MAANGHDKEAISRVIESFGRRPEMLVQILERIVRRTGWVPEATVRQLAEELNLSRAEVHGVVSFYHDFRTSPPGRHVIKICQAESCQAMGGRELTEYAQSALGQDMHDTRGDITLEPVYCLGNCACSPAVMIDEHTYGRVSHEQFDRLVGALQGDDS